jgi:hypothetical protein
MLGQFIQKIPEGQKAVLYLGGRTFVVEALASPKELKGRELTMCFLDEVLECTDQGLWNS